MMAHQMSYMIRYDLATYVNGKPTAARCVA
jgi:hypothetical protein